MRLVLPALLALAAGPALAQNAMPTEAPGAPDVARAVAGTYTVDPAHTQLLFTVNHLGFSEYSGMFVEPTGTLILDPKNPQSDKVDVTFPVAKVRTTVAALDAHLQKPEFFDAAKYPTAHFVSSKVTVTGTTATIDGTLDAQRRRQAGDVGHPVRRRRQGRDGTAQAQYRLRRDNDDQAQRLRN